MSGHEFESYFPESGSVDMSDPTSDIDETTYAELRELAGRYPQPRSALLPMLHLVQSVDGRISPKGIEACAEVLGISTAQVSGVATFYTMYKRRPAGLHHVGVCTTALCAVMGGDVLLETASKHLGIGVDETTPDGRISLERIECNAACDFAPVMMVNWEFMDDMTPEKAVALLDDLRDGTEVTSTRGARLTSWREAERVLAGFPDGRADEGPSAGAPSLLGLRVAEDKGWAAPGDDKPHGDGVVGRVARTIAHAVREVTGTDDHEEPKAATPASAPTQSTAAETAPAEKAPRQRRRSTKPGEGTAK
jgi:NADH-quinone oxidoreductase subunit E